jgi:hypothetical protein
MEKKVRAMRNAIKTVVFLCLFSFFAVEAFAQDKCASTLLKNAAKSYKSKKYAEAASALEECISLYGERALKEQQNMQKGMKGCFNFTLSDVGYAHYLIIKVYLDAGDKEKAQFYFKELEEKYSLADYWDEDANMFFKVIDKARQLIEKSK